MEDDDEFGDLYTDVLLPFSSSLSSGPEENPHPLPPPPPPPPPPPRPAIGLALQPANSAPEPRVSGAGRSDGEKELQFDIEDGSNGVADDSMPLIPGLDGGGSWNGPGVDDVEEDSESEDDLQIVLNDTRGAGARAGEVDDEDDKPLGIVADGDAGQGIMEERDWGMGEDGVGAGEEGGERKEGRGREGGPHQGWVWPETLESEGTVGN